MNNQTLGSLSFLHTVLADVRHEYGFYAIDKDKCEEAVVQIPADAETLYLEVLGCLLDTGKYVVKGYGTTNKLSTYTGEHKRSLLTLEILSSISDYIIVSQHTVGKDPEHPMADITTTTYRMRTWNEYELEAILADIDPALASCEYQQGLANIATVVHSIAEDISISHHQSHLYEYIEELETFLDDYRKAIFFDSEELRRFAYDSMDRQVRLLAHRRTVEVADAYLNSSIAEEYID